MARLLIEYLRDTMRLPFVWGQCDCALWAAGAVEYATGFDPAAAMRGEYSTAREMVGILNQSGGLLNLIQINMLGFECGEVLDGIAVCQVGKRQFAGLLIRGAFWTKSNGGVVSDPSPEILEGWSLCHKQ